MPYWCCLWKDIIKKRGLIFRVLAPQPANIQVKAVAENAEYIAVDNGRE
jgi:hypothetical protein